MKPPRPLTKFRRAALAALSTTLLACAAYAQDSQQTRPQESKPGQNIVGPSLPSPITKKAVVTAKPAPEISCPPGDKSPLGVVRLRAILSASGSVQGISVVKGLPGGLTEKAIEAARQIKFTPAEKDGRKVSQYVMLEYNFNAYYDDDDREVTKKVLITEQPRPVYTEEALKNRVAGTVVIEALFCKDGKVVSPEVVQGLPDGLSEKALEAARRIKFVPAEVNGHKVSVVSRVKYLFSPDSPAIAAANP